MTKASAAKSRSSYDVHPGVAMVQKWVTEMKEKTGRSLEEWITLVKKEGPSGHMNRVRWLKTKHNVGHNSAWGIAERVDGNGDHETPEAYLQAAVRYVDQQYAGPKEKLRPIYERLLALGRSVGTDVRACPCRTMVPLYRKHVFAQIKPSTNDRLDFGFALASHKGKLPKRLVDTGGLAKKDRITHRIEIVSAADVDEDVRKWLKIAYELDV
jgi:Domain of unknown function (DUF5655)/Domain of unknown function (DUF4287)